MNESFLNEEYRSDFFVDKQRKMLWKIELDILQEIIRICNKYNISYFFHSGSALGVVRHQGFIPWDDDLDIGMLRVDFERFIEVSKTEVKPPLFVQYGMNDNGHICGLLRLRNSNSSGIIRIDKDKDCNNGVFVEIYPFDNVSDNGLKRKLQYFRSKLYYHGLLAWYYGAFSRKQKFLLFFIKIIGIKRAYKRWQKICQCYNSTSCKYVNTVALPDYACEGIYLIERQWLTELVTKKFEYIQVNIPKNIDAILKQNYGNYMDLPPIKERGIYHKKTVFYDPYTPFTNYKGSKILNDYFK